MRAEDYFEALLINEASQKAQNDTIWIHCSKYHGLGQIRTKQQSGTNDGYDSPW